MSTFLFTAQPSIGHLNPMLTIARQLQSDGHTIAFAGTAPARIEKGITASGFRFFNLRPSVSTLGLLLLPFTSGYVETFMAIRLFFSGLSYYAQAIGRILDEFRPDVVVSDFSFHGACLAAESKDIPYVIIYHAGLSFKGQGVPPFGSGLPIGETWGGKEKLYYSLSNSLERSVDSAIARARKKLGLPSGGKGYLTRPSSPWLTLVLTAEAIEAPRFPLTPSTFFVGPCFSSKQSTKVDDFPFDQLSPDKPKIYVSLGTVFNRKPKVFSKIIHAFADGRYQTIVSAGGAFARLRAQNLPADVLLFERVPQVEILSRVDAVISHGGNNTVNETLAAGKPLLVMPIGGEQGDNASRVVYLGVGLRADIKRASSQEIGTKVSHLIEEPTFRQRAEEIADALALTQGQVTAVKFIKRVAETRQPIVRPELYPLTVTIKTPAPWES